MGEEEGVHEADGFGNQTTEERENEVGGFVVKVDKARKIKGFVNSFSDGDSLQAMAHLEEE